MKLFTASCVRIRFGSVIRLVQGLPAAGRLRHGVHDRLRSGVFGRGGSGNIVRDTDLFVAGQLCVNISVRKGIAGDIPDRERVAESRRLSVLLLLPYGQLLEFVCRKPPGFRNAADCYLLAGLTFVGYNNKTEVIYF